MGWGMGELQTLDRPGVRSRPPLMLRWDEPGPPVAGASGTQACALLALSFGSTKGLTIHCSSFDFTGHVRRLCLDIIRRCPELGHIRLANVLIGFTQARNGRAYGLQARVTPLRFHGGLLVRRHRGIPYQIQRFIVAGQDVLYLMTFCLPRFLNQAFDDKLVTLFHELFHISPRFDGDLRRHEGRYASAFAQPTAIRSIHRAGLARAYLATEPDPALREFLRHDFGELRRRHGGVVGVAVPRPKLVPLTVDLF